MKKIFLCLVAIMLMAAMAAGCGAPAPAEPAQTTAPAQTTPETQAPATEASAETTAPAVAAPSDLVDEAYAQVVGRYYTALTEQWTEDKYFENDMSALAAYYYDGNPLENVGFAYLDLDNNGQNELIIGAIAHADQDPSVFEIWTIADGEPVMLAQGGSRNRYVMQFPEEDNAWYVVNEASNSAASYAVYYLMLIEGKLEVTQGILFDATADEQNPWFMTYDLDWDVSNDEPIDEELANAILDSNRMYYTALEYIPYTNFNEISVRGAA